MKRRGLTTQLRCLFPRENHRIGFDAQIIIRRERHRGVPAPWNMAILESVVLLVVTMCQPFRIGDNFGGILLHSSTLPFASGAGKQS